MSALSGYNAVHMWPRLLRGLDSPFVVAGIVTAAYVVFLASQLRIHGKDPSTFVLAADYFVQAGKAPPSLFIEPQSTGYDGQFYYRLALDPFTTKKTDFGIRLDNPPYRQQRILYPILVWAAIGGRPDLVSWGMLAVNLAALCVLGLLAGLLVQNFGQHALYALALPFYPGFLWSFARDLAEIVAVTLLLAGWLLLRRSRYGACTLAFAFSLLAKETGLLFLIAIVAEQFLARARGRAINWNRVTVFLIPTAAWVTWQALLTQLWGTAPVLAGGVNFAVPFVAFGQLAVKTLAHLSPDRRIAIAMVLTVGQAVASLWVWRSSRLDRSAKWAWAMYFGLAAVLSSAVWVEDIAFLRVLAEFYMLGAMLLIASSTRLKIPVLGAWMLLWVYTFRQVG